VGADESGKMSEPHRSKRSETVRCFYCDKAGSPWFLCDCEWSRGIRDGEYRKPRVIRLRDGSTVIEHDEVLLPIVLQNNRFSRFIPARSSVTSRDEVWIGPGAEPSRVPASREELEYPERPMTAAERAAAYRHRRREGR
jgi:hypothetical protein